MWFISLKSSIEDGKKTAVWKATAAEFIGTAFLVFIGCGSAVTSQPEQSIHVFVTRVALTFGLTVATLVWCIAGISGGHINPAVTVAFLVTRKISLLRAFLYIVFQCLGAITGAGLLCAISSLEIRDGDFGCTALKQGKFPIDDTQGILIEALITFILIFTVFATCDSKREDLKGSGPLAIGIAVLICHLAMIPLTGSSMNPARSLGPAVIKGGDCWVNHYVYWIGPILGGLTAGLLYDLVFAADATFLKMKHCLTNQEYDLSTLEEGHQ